MKTFQERRGLVSVCTDYNVAVGQPGRYLITEEHNDGYVVIARFAKLADAKRALADMEGR